MNPAHGLRHNAWSSINECINAKMTQFMAAGSYKQNVAYGLGDIQRPHEFEPASNASGAFAGASVPTATRCHHDQWWQGSITAIDFGSDVERGGGRPLHGCDQANLSATLRILAQKGLFHTEYLQDGGTERLQEGISFVGA